MNPQFDRIKLKFKSLRERKNKVSVNRNFVKVDDPVRFLSTQAEDSIKDAVKHIKDARDNGRPVIMAFGAHAIKNGLAPVIIKLLEQGWLSHIATNGAGIIHDWEFAFQGASSEDVKENVKKGEFGMWEETGFYLNAALNVGAFKGLGYGESVGYMVFKDGLEIPDAEQLKSDALSGSAAATDLLSIIRKFDLKPGFMKISHPYKEYSVQAAAFRLNIPSTGHPMFGHDIIYTHPMNHGASIGRTAQRDFLSFVHSVSSLTGGVYLSIGSAVMSPMIFEKSLSMAQNLALQQGSKIQDFRIYVVDLSESEWDWQHKGEPPPDNPAYYCRFCKSFSRMGGRMDYIKADNRDFLLALLQQLNQ